MVLINIPLMYGSAHIEPVGRISIFNDELERLLIANVEAYLFGRPQDIVKLEFGIESRVVSHNDITIISFLLIPTPSVKKDE